ncbi:hypothetical protein [Sphaerimonospora thailandensis]|uniref:Uncharacterized protein n=1 Tax=Sphaerimonospora thailandensis TaxID=795644 RepID=A0A8J3R9P5_9ACTN|nr:hypothetical protein [Sphaerimonospora thailandensis]GIH70341.1 hypothetical protein Mth01_25940 [Sphaerimonospora thailandensis]
MADIELDGSGLLDIVKALDGAERQAANRAYEVVEKHAKELRNEWRDNARDTARRHGRHYPKAITAEQIPAKDAVEWEVGPEEMREQGGMGRGFEYGGPRQPPHLDGARATVKVEPGFIAALDEIARDLL